MLWELFESRCDELTLIAIPGAAELACLVHNVTFGQLSCENLEEPEHYHRRTYSPAKAER